MDCPGPADEAKREHRIPLCGGALEVLDAARSLGDRNPLVFPMRSGRAISPSTLPKMLQYHRIAAVALAPAFVRTAPPGHHIDGNGLYLYVQPTGARSWIQRLVIRGKRCELGLGSVALVSLAEAREKAVSNRKLARSGGDPLADKRRLQSVPAFAEATAAVVEQKQPGWKNAEQVRAWRNSLRRYAFPRIGTRPVSEVESADVLAILTPIWHAKPVIAKAVRQRIHAVLEWAIAMNLRNDNPADRVRPVLGPQRNIVEHMRALPHREVAAALAAVRASRKKPVDKLAFEFLVSNRFAIPPLTLRSFG